ncbi:MAG: serine protease [Hormoscilla sp.]
MMGECANSKVAVRLAVRFAVRFVVKTLVFTLAVRFVVKTLVFTLAVMLVSDTAVLSPLWPDEHQISSEESQRARGDRASGEIRRIAQQTTVRVMTGSASGSGVIVDRTEGIYTVVTNWHVLKVNDSQIIAPDGARYQLFGEQQLGKNDLAIARFRSSREYAVAAIGTEPLAEGERVYAAGFPMYSGDNFATTFELGLEVFQLTAGKLSLLLPKSMPEGYSLGYSNDIVVGMSGGPIFNDRGKLIGINGRLKGRDPGFGVYRFADGTMPSEQLLERMIYSSWGIPISTYLQFISRPESQSWNKRMTGER